MWGDTDHIKKLKEQQATEWPDDFPAPKKAKKGQAKADRAAQKAADAEARKLAKWTQTTPKPTKQPPAKRPNAADLANLKAAEWQAKQEAHDAKAHQRALKATVRAEKRAQQAQARAEDAEGRAMNLAFRVAELELAYATNPVVFIRGRYYRVTLEPAPPRRTNHEARS